MAMFTMNEDEYFKTVEEQTIVELYCCEFCYVINPVYRTIDRIKNQQWCDALLRIIDHKRYLRYRQWVMMGNACCMLE